MNTYGDALVLVQAALTDGWGGQRVRDWDNATRTDWPAAVQPRRTTENTAQAQVTTTDKVAFLAPECPVAAVDRIEWGGHTYTVQGEPALHHMQGKPDHIEVLLERIAEAEE